MSSRPPWEPAGLVKVPYSSVSSPLPSRPLHDNENPQSRHARESHYQASYQQRPGSQTRPVQQYHQASHGPYPSSKKIPSASSSTDSIIHVDDSDDGSSVFDIDDETPPTPVMKDYHVAKEPVSDFKIVDTPLYRSMTSPSQPLSANRPPPMRSPRQTSAATVPAITIPASREHFDPRQNQRQFNPYVPPPSRPAVSMTANSPEVSSDALQSNATTKKPLGSRFKHAFGDFFKKKQLDESTFERIESRHWTDME